MNSDPFHIVEAKDVPIILQILRSRLPISGGVSFVYIELIISDIFKHDFSRWSTWLSQWIRMQDKFAKCPVSP